MEFSIPLINFKEILRKVKKLKALLYLITYFKISISFVAYFQTVLFQIFGFLSLKAGVCSVICFLFFSSSYTILEIP